MTKDEMNVEMEDKISMALKDPILQMGFEVICSKLSRLEKENAELKEQCLILADCNTCHSTCKNENVEMKKQLAKAKELIEKMKCCENCRYYSRTYGHCYSYDSYQNCKSLSNWRLDEWQKIWNFEIYITKVEGLNDCITYFEI